MKYLVLVLAVVCTSALAQRRGPARIAVPLPPLPPINYDQPGNPSPTPSQYSASPAQQYSASPAQQYSASPAQEYSPSPTQSQYSGSPKYSPRPQEYDNEPQSRQKDYVTPIPIIRFDKEQSIDGSYKSSYETGNNIIAEETGFLKNIGIKDEEALVQHGSYTYTSPDGTVITVTYTADEGGFRAEGSHLPTPPPVPEEIQKSLDLIYEQIRLQAEKEAKDPNYQKNLQENETTNNSADNYPRRFRK